MMDSQIADEIRPKVTLHIWDFLCRLIPGSFFVYLAIANTLQLFVILRAQNHNLGLFYFTLSVFAKFAFIVFLTLHCILFVLRWRPIGKAQGARPRALAILGSFFFYLLAIPHATPSLAQLAIGSLLLCLGTCLAILSLSKLGRSYSMMAEARRLITTGPYSIVRHPMYISEQIAIAGIVIQNFSLYACALFTIHLWIQIQRMQHEESILKETFPEYDDYEHRTARLIPGVY